MNCFAPFRPASAASIMVESMQLNAIIRTDMSNIFSKTWRRLVNRLTTTTGVMRQEFYVILFLVVGLLVGVSVKQFFEYEAKRDVALKMQQEFFDTTEEDSLLADVVSARPLLMDTLADAPEKTPRVKLNLNTATQQQLEQVPGLTPELADRIIRYRKDKGRYRHLDELLTLKGIGERKFQKLKPFLTLE
jgi:competence ComEA-like helix-hairpin-helix protein